MNGDECIDELIRAGLAATREVEAELMAYYNRLDDRGLAQKMTLVQYRCTSKRCLLARVLPSTLGQFVVVFGHRYSSAAAARRTAPGQRVSPTRARLLREPDETVQFACDHVHTDYGGITLHIDHDEAVRTRTRVNRRIGSAQGA